MSKKQKSSFGIFTEAVGLYFSNLGQFMKYMTFPVLGQIAGLGIVFLTTYYYSLNLPKLLDKYENLATFEHLVLMTVIVSLPGLAIFCKAFWEYLVAYGAINSMLDNLLRSGRVYDFDAHKDLIKRRSIPFVGLWLLFSLFTLVAVCPLFWVICGIFAVYFVLVFQVFTFEPELSPVGCVKKSFNLIKGHFAPTFILICLAGLITYLILPQLLNTFFDVSGINKFFANMLLPFVNIFPSIDLEMYGLKPITGMDIAIITVQTFTAQIIIQYTLPLRSIMWSLWYKELGGNFSQASVKSAKSKKRPSEKLMEESHKKYSKKKLDTNILRRAMEKDDE